MSHEPFGYHGGPIQPALSKPNQEVGALGATIKKRREELQEVTHTNAVEMDSIKTKAAEAVAKAKEDHEKKVNVVTHAAVVSWEGGLTSSYRQVETESPAILEGRPKHGSSDFPF